MCRSSVPSVYSNAKQKEISHHPRGGAVFWHGKARNGPCPLPADPPGQAVSSCLARYSRSPRATQISIAHLRLGVLTLAPRESRTGSRIRSARLQSLTKNTRRTLEDTRSACQNWYTQAARQGAVSLTLCVSCEATSHSPSVRACLSQTGRRVVRVHASRRVQLVKGSLISSLDSESCLVRAPWEAAFPPQRTDSGSGILHNCRPRLRMINLNRLD